MGKVERDLARLGFYREVGFGLERFANRIGDILRGLVKIRFQGDSCCGTIQPSQNQTKLERLGEIR